MDAPNRKHIMILVSFLLRGSLRARIGDAIWMFSFLLSAEIRYLRLQGYSVMWDKYVYDLLKLYDNGLFIHYKIIMMDTVHSVRSI
jgi:hypothetical protein